MCRPLTVKSVALGTLTLVLGLSQAAVSYSSPVSYPTETPFHVYPPTWLPSGFHRVPDPETKRYPNIQATFFSRRYAAHRQWVALLEGPAQCCLDSQTRHRVGRTLLSGNRTAYFSDQGTRFGGLYLFWDQGQTYIVVNSPNVTKKVLIDIAQSIARPRKIEPCYRMVQASDDPVPSDRVRTGQCQPRCRRGIEHAFLCTILATVARTQPPIADEQEPSHRKRFSRSTH